jgi:hypothetical protein
MLQSPAVILGRNRGVGSRKADLDPDLGIEVMGRDGSYLEPQFLRVEIRIHKFEQSQRGIAQSTHDTQAHMQHALIGAMDTMLDSWM